MAQNESPGETLADANVLVTGGTGFLGGALVRRLGALGAHITVVGRNTLQGERLARQGIRFLATNLKDKAAIERACDGQDLVVHCGAKSSLWGRYRDFFQANVMGTQNVIAGCQTHHVARLIHVSTPAVYFDFTNRVDISENEPLAAKPANHYACTKQIAEQHVDRAFEQGLPSVTIRPRAIFGPGDTAILPRLIRALETNRLRIIENGQNTVDVTFVENAVDALLLAGESPSATLGKKYNITNGEPVRCGT